MPLDHVPTKEEEIEIFSLFKSSFVGQIIYKPVKPTFAENDKHRHTEASGRSSMVSIPNLETIKENPEEIGPSFYESLKSPLFWSYTVAFTILSFRIKVSFFCQISQFKKFVANHKIMFKLKNLIILRL